MLRKSCLMTLAALMALGADLHAATYLHLPDATLLARSPLVIVAETSGETVLAAQQPGEEGFPYSLVPLRVQEVLKGTSPTEVLLRLPGGTAPDGRRAFLEGTPSFQRGGQVVLFLSPIDGREREYTLTEFALSKFDVMEDQAGRLFAVRTTFQAGDDVTLSADGKGEAEPDAIRELPSLLSAVRTASSGATPTPVPMPAVTRGIPVGVLKPHVVGRSALWVNIGGSESGPNLYRWFWDTGASPTATVTVPGTQSNLTDGSNGMPHVQNAVDQWKSIASTSVQVTGLTTGGNVTVHLDVDSAAGGWSAPMDCAYGVIGLGGPGSAFGPKTFKGESPYYAPRSGEIWMRHNTCSSGYEYTVFRTAVLHELGHVLGLGHSDSGQSTHSATTSPQTSGAVMHSSVSAARPSGPEIDDIQAMQYYYGIAGGCSYLVNPISAGSPAEGGASSVSVSTTAGCAWTASSNSSFLTVTSGATASGSGTVQYSVAANSGAARIGTLTIAGQTFTVNQAAASVACSYDLDTSTASPSAAGGSFSVAVSTTSGCTWAATSNSVFLTITSGALGSGSGTVQYTVSSNSGAARSGTLTIAGRTLIVSQAALGTFALSVTKTGSGSGAVASNPAGLSCAPPCTASFPSGQSVVLTATPSPGSYFTGWSDACTGTGTCVTTLSASRSVTASFELNGSCVANATALALQSNRFKLQGSYLLEDGSAGVLSFSSLTDASGYFTFKDLSDIQAVVKVLNTCGGYNNRFWVFIGALTTQQVRIEVTDTKTGVVKVYFNPLGNVFLPVQDTDAFATCP